MKSSGTHSEINTLFTVNGNENWDKYYGEQVENYMG
jgi:hypothetical protein